MARPPQHPEVQQIGLSSLYDALSDPLRRRIVAMLGEGQELSCSFFADKGSKTHLSYHFARLREAGLTLTRLEGTTRYIRLRIDDLDTRFPGWLDAVLVSMKAEQAAIDAAGEPLIAARAKAPRKVAAKVAAKPRARSVQRAA